MRIRKQELGNRNIIGAKVEARRKIIGMKQIELLTMLQVKGVELTASGLSKLEGQIRCVNDYELVAIAEILGVTLDWLVGLGEKEEEDTIVVEDGRLEVLSEIV